MNQHHQQYLSLNATSSSSTTTSLLDNTSNGNHQVFGGVLNGDGNCYHHHHPQQQQQLSTSTTMIHDFPLAQSPSLIQSSKQLSSMSTVTNNQNGLNIHNVLSTQTSSPPIITTQINNRSQLAITAPSPSHAFGTSNLSPFSFNGGNGLRDRAISSPPPLAHMKKHTITPSSTTNNPSPNSSSGHSGSSGLTSPNCSDQMNLDDDCTMTDQGFEERPRRFSLPSNDLINMPFFRQKPQNLTSFQLFNPDTPINEPEIELKDITGTTVLSHSDCKEQYEMLVEELKEFNLYFSCDNI